MTGTGMVANFRTAGIRLGTGVWLCAQLLALAQDAWPVAALQVALDRRQFSPGCIDDHLGAQTRAALRAWQSAHRLPVTGVNDAATAATLADDAPPIAEYTLTAEDFARLGPAPTDWQARAAQTAMPYETILELVAERFHATQRFLRLLNPQVDWDALRAPATVRVPNVMTGQPLPKAGQIRINLGQKWLTVYDPAGCLCAFFPCSIGRDKLRRPVGDLQIVALAPHPNYTFDPKVFPESPEAQAIGRKLIVPPGPNNPVGVLWLSIGRARGSPEPPLSGYGIHGTPKPEEIGKTESHGCFRLANWNVERLGDMITIGTPVIVEAQ